MRILLVQAYMGGREPAIFPIGLASLKSSLDGHQVRVFDPNIWQNPWDELKATILGFDPQIIGISLRNIDSTNKRTVVFYFAYLKELLDRVKAGSEAKIIVGGSGFSMFAAEIMAIEPRIDFGVYLEGETVFPDLIENLATPERIKSVYYRKDGKLLFTGLGQPCDLKGTQMPDWEILPLSSYLGRDAMGIETKRGCALGCIYCTYGFLNGKEYRLKDPVRVVDEIEHLANRCGVGRFMFLDSVFNIPRRHCAAVCHEILRRGVRVRWSAWFSEANISEEFLELIAQAGCDTVMLSPDALCDPVLKRLGKSLSRKQILAAYQLLRKSKRFDLSYNFFKNPPGQTLANFLSIVLFCLRARWQMGRKVHFELNSLRVEPHTVLHQIALREGMVTAGNSLLFPTYYINKKTWFLGTIIDLLLSWKGK
jgi:anaerobic magnesium-protoporphyrin IX monomethyl ester cyclase